MVYLIGGACMRANLLRLMCSAGAGGRGRGAEEEAAAAKEGGNGEFDAGVLRSHAQSVRAHHAAIREGV